MSLLPNAKLSEILAVVGTIDPQVVEDTAKYSDGIDMSAFEQVLCILLLGDMAAYTIDFAVYEDTDGAGTSEASLIACTQLAAHATNNDNKQLVINVRQEQLTQGMSYIRMRTVGEASQTGASAAVALGLAKYQPSVSLDLASVAEIKEA